MIPAKEWLNPLVFFTVCAVIVISVQGCSTAGYLASAVAAHCENTPENRAMKREAAAVIVAPHRIHIVCAGDVPE